MVLTVGAGHQGTGPVYTKIGGRVRYAVSDIEAYEQERRYRSPAEEWKKLFEDD